MVAEREIAKLQTTNETEIPNYLVREELGGRKWFYKGYKDVLSKKNERKNRK